jgi:hypothetical protein
MDSGIRSAVTKSGRITELASIVVVEKAFFHCGKCITRSNLWEVDREHAGECSGDAPAL